MERNSEATESSSVPYESNLEEEKIVARAALCLCSFAFHDQDYEMKEVANLGNKSQKKKAESGTVNRKAMRNGSVEKFPKAENGKGIDECILPKLPPVESLNGLIGICSKPFEKQLTKSDLKESQNRLLFNAFHAREHLLHMLNPGEDLIAGIPVNVYDSEGRIHPMTFKVWGRAYVLIGEWIKFAKGHGFQEGKDRITIWIFRHSCTQKLCFVIISRRLPTFEMATRKEGLGAATTSKGRKRRRPAML